MAKFLTTLGTAANIEQIIINASNYLTFITPYLKLNQNFLERLSDSDKAGVKITLIYGKTKLPKQELESLQTFNNLQIFFCENLHAKCYFNDSYMIITSMNLHEYSERNNREMGILIDKVTDEEIFNNTLKEVESIKNASKLEKNFTVLEINKVEKEGSNTPELSKFWNRVENEVIIKPTPESKNNFIPNPKYSEIENFYLPELRNILKEKYPKKEIILNRDLTVYDFPCRGVKLVIDYRISFLFQTTYNYDKIVKINKGLLNKDLPGIRFYWNSEVLNIYLEKNFRPNLDKSGHDLLVSKTLRIIETVNKNLKLA